MESVRLENRVSGWGVAVSQGLGVEPDFGFGWTMGLLALLQVQATAWGSAERSKQCVAECFGLGVWGLFGGIGLIWAPGPSIVGFGLAEDLALGALLNSARRRPTKQQQPSLKCTVLPPALLAQKTDLPNKTHPQINTHK